MGSTLGMLGSTHQVDRRVLRETPLGVISIRSGASALMEVSGNGTGSDAVNE